MKKLAPPFRIPRFWSLYQFFNFFYFWRHSFILSFSNYIYNFSLNFSLKTNLLVSDWLLKKYDSSLIFVFIQNRIISCLLIIINYLKYNFFEYFKSTNVYKRKFNSYESLIFRLSQVFLA